jgi:hypothetical protein
VYDDGDFEHGCWCLCAAVEYDGLPKRCFGASARLETLLAVAAVGVNAPQHHGLQRLLCQHYWQTQRVALTPTGANNIGIGTNAGRTGGTPEGIVNITTESNRIVMGNDDHTCAQIKIAWTATSDCRDKTCFKPIAHGLDFVRALKPTEYQFKQGGRDSAETDGKRRYGFLAQDILPLEGDAPVIISADNPEKLQYTESHLIPILVKAIQELTARVEELENNA